MRIADDTFLGNSECEWVKRTQWEGEPSSHAYTIQNKIERAFLITHVLRNYGKKYREKRLKNDIAHKLEGSV